MVKKWIGMFTVVSVVMALVVVLGIGCAAPTPTTPTTPAKPTTTPAKPTTPAVPAGPTYDWNISQPYPEGTLLYATVEDLVERVAAASDGRITLTHYPGTLLGDYTAQQEAIAAGTHDMAFTWPSTAMNPKWDISKLGSIMYNWEDAYAAFEPGGWNSTLWDGIAEETNWKLLGLNPGGSMNVISNKLFDITNPGGLKIRVQSNRVIQARYDALGFNPITMPMSDVASSLAIGTIDASSGCSFAEFKVYGDAFKYVYAVSEHFSATPGVMNLDLFNSLSAADQKLLLDAASGATDAAWEKLGDDVVKNWNGLLDWQIVVTLDGNRWSALAQKVRDGEWTAAEALLGTNLVDLVREHATPLPWGLSLEEMNYGWGILTNDWVINRQGSIVTGP